MRKIILLAILVFLLAGILFFARGKKAIFGNGDKLFSGVLIFPILSKETKLLNLIIADMAEVKERKLKWIF